MVDCLRNGVNRKLNEGRGFQRTNRRRSKGGRNEEGGGLQKTEKKEEGVSGEIRVLTRS